MERCRACITEKVIAAVFINGAEDGLLHDFEIWLESLAPHEATGKYQQNRTGEELLGHGKRGRGGDYQWQARFGPWEQIFYGEFDGRRRKRVLAEIIGE